MECILTSRDEVALNDVTHGGPRSSGSAFRNVRPLVSRKRHPQTRHIGH
jgi:hypothetical protein